MVRHGSISIQLVCRGGRNRPLTTCEAAVLLACSDALHFAETGRCTSLKEGQASLAESGLLQPLHSKYRGLYCCSFPHIFLPVLKMGGSTDPLQVGDFTANAFASDEFTTAAPTYDYPWVLSSRVVRCPYNVLISGAAIQDITLSAIRAMRLGC